MLAELTIRNFAIVDQLTLGFGPGFNVLTGETGAGKSLIVDAVAFLLGGKAVPGLLRSGAESAWVEGVFTFDGGSLAEEVEALLAQNGLAAEEGAIILTREYRPAGRGSLRVNGRAVVQAVLQQLGESLVDIHGQTEHLSLLRTAEHLAFLDRYGGLTENVRQVAAAVDRWRQIRNEIERLSQDERELARRVDLLKYEVEEISGASPRPGEDVDLEEEQRLLGNAEQRSLLAQAGRADLDGGEAAPSALENLRQMAARLGQLARLDGKAEGLAQEAEVLVIQGEELSRSLRAYAEAVEFSSARLEAVQERLALLKRLKRKYGSSLEEVLAYGKEARRELEAVEHNEERLEALRAEEQRVGAEVGELAAALSQRRAEAAVRLSQSMEEQLAELNLGGTRFAVSLDKRPDADGLPLPGESGRFAFTREGVDYGEFMVATNPGEPLRPLSRVASGGESSRLMLALKAVLTQADPTSTLIFDEIDTGLGGRSGGVVGEKLRRLADAHQVICVTHLPQIAGFADCHFSVAKGESGGRNVVRVERLDGEARVAELAAMLGGDSAVTRQAVRELLERSRGATRQGAA